MNRKQRRAAARSGIVPELRPGAVDRIPGTSGLLTNALQYHRAGQLADAERCYRKILAIDENHFHALHLRGVLAQQMGQSELAKRLIGKAIALNDPASLDQKNAPAAGIGFQRRNSPISQGDLANAHSNFSIVLMSLGRPVEALKAIQRSIALAETDNTKLLFVECVQALSAVPEDVDIRANLARALSEPWGRPIELARISAAVIKWSGETGACMRRFADFAIAGQRQPIAAAELKEISGDLLLKSLLEATPIFDAELEQFLTTVRKTMLRMAADGGELESRGQDLLRFFCALSRQCFINEYVFACSNEEYEVVERLRASLAHSLDHGVSIREAWLPAIAAYTPLASLPAVHLLPLRRLSSPVADLVTAQLEEAEQEAQLRASLPRLTAIDEPTSLAVQRQYEENPYPRWVKASPPGSVTTIYAHLREQFPSADLRGFSEAEASEILIAGCGTGRHSIETARRFKGARVLAIDLSRASLAYAKRKTQELGLKNVEYAQADILKLGGIGCTFDVIEASGVLHHLSAPMAGWQVLLSLLRPGGVMRLGFYSRLARRALDPARAFVAQRGYGPSADDIRRCRQELMGLAHDKALARVFDWGDFFSTSACRDLLFHIEEHEMSLPEIGAFLQHNRLQFLGFILSNNVRGRFRSRFPDDVALADLDSWHTFELENPATFSGMYEFWVRKPA